MGNYKYLFECDCIREVGDHKIGTDRLRRQVLCPEHDVGLKGKIWVCKHCGRDFPTSKQCGYADTCPDCVDERNRQYIRSYRDRVAGKEIGKRDTVNRSDAYAASEESKRDPVEFPELKIPTINDYPELFGLMLRS